MTLPLAWLGDVLRDAGLTVVETSGWQERSADSGEPPRPVGVLEHHTATWASEDDPAPSVQLCVDGRPDLDGPLCHGLIGFDGTVHLISAGRANHAGEAKMSGPNPSGDGNVLYVGFEWDYQGVEQAPSTEQYDAAVRATEAVLNHLDRPADAARGHLETSVTGKIDPGNVDLDGFRADIAKIVTDERKPRGSGGNSVKGDSAKSGPGPASPEQRAPEPRVPEQQSSGWGDRERDILQRIEAELLGRRTSRARSRAGGPSSARAPSSGCSWTWSTGCWRHNQGPNSRGPNNRAGKAFRPSKGTRGSGGTRSSRRAPSKTPRWQRIRRASRPPSRRWRPSRPLRCWRNWCRSSSRDSPPRSSRPRRNSGPTELRTARPTAT